MPKTDRRNYPRVPTDTTVCVWVNGSHTVGQVHDLSAGGARLSLMGPLRVGQTVRMLFETGANHFESVDAVAVRRFDDGAGVRFKSPTSRTRLLGA